MRLSLVVVSLRALRALRSLRLLRALRSLRLLRALCSDRVGAGSAILKSGAGVDCSFLFDRSPRFASLASLAQYAPRVACRFTSGAVAVGCRSRGARRAVGRARSLSRPSRFSVAPRAASGPPLWCRPRRRALGFRRARRCAAACSLWSARLRPWRRVDARGGGWGCARNERVDCLKP